MQPAWPALPKFYTIRNKPVTAPVCWPAYRIYSKFFFIVFYILFYYFPVFNNLALRRCPGANLATYRS